MGNSIEFYKILVKKFLGHDFEYMDTESKPYFNSYFDNMERRLKIVEKEDFLTEEDMEI